MSHIFDFTGGAFILLALGVMVIILQTFLSKTQSKWAEGIRKQQSKIK